MTGPMKICGCVLDADPDEVSRLLTSPALDLVEWRLDAFLARHGRSAVGAMPTVLATFPRRPVLVTNRPQRHGGHFAGPERERLDILEEAARLGADWVDLEDDVDGERRQEFRRLGARVLVSHHDFSGTPELETLQAIARKLAAHADCIKIVTTARQYGDCLRVLEMVPWGKDNLGVDVIAFCMGAPGRWSRVASLLLGSAWTYARLAHGPEAAPGQYTVGELRALLEMLV